jgi:integrase
MAHIYKRGCKFWISYYLSGKLIQKSLMTKNERVALAKQKRIEYELALGDLYVASKTPLSAMLESFCKELMATRTFKSYKNDFSRLRIFFGPVCDLLEPGVPGAKFGTKSDKTGFDKYAGKHIKAELLEDISTEVINRFIAERIQQDGWSPKTANLLRQTLHKLFAYAIKHYGFRSRDRKYSNPLTGVDRQKEPAPQIRFLRPGEIIVQLRVLAEAEVIHALVSTYIYAGLRREEALWLTPIDIDLINRLIRVQAKTVDGECWQPKTKRNRVVPISDALYGILCTYKPWHDSNWFFPSPKGKRWNPDNFSQDLKKINQANGLDWTCLDFRHTFGSQLAQNGVSLYKIATLMGNSPEICRRHYAALIPEEMAEIVEFSVKERSNISDNATKEMFEEILGVLKGKDQETRNIPHLKLIHFDESA